VAQKVAGTWINHEDVSPGYAYMAYVTANGMWTQIGSAFPDSHSDLVAGYNMITLPLQYARDQGIDTGQDLGESIPNCTNVLRRNAAAGQWVSVAQKVAGTWINHEDVSPGYAYMAYITDPSVWP